MFHSKCVSDMFPQTCSDTRWIDRLGTLRGFRAGGARSATHGSVGVGLGDWWPVPPFVTGKGQHEAKYLLPSSLSLIRPLMGELSQKGRF